MSTAPTWRAVQKHGQERIAEIKDELLNAAPDSVTRLQIEAKVWQEVLGLEIKLSPETRVQPEAAPY